jgi:hypothetical protein
MWASSKRDLIPCLQLNKLTNSKQLSLLIGLHTYVNNAYIFSHKLLSKYLKYASTFILTGREFLPLFWENYIDCRCLKRKCWVRYPDLRNRKQKEAERATGWKISLLVYCIWVFTWAELKAPKAIIRNTQKLCWWTSWQKAMWQI